MSKNGFMLDTNVFNRVLDDGSISLPMFDARKMFVTHVQRDELEATPKNPRKELLLKTFARIDAASLPTDTSVWDDSRWDEANWSAPDGKYEQLLNRIKELDEAKGKKPRDPMNQSRDARIAETAIKRELTLVTNDRSLSQAAIEAGGDVISFEAFCTLT